MEMKYVHIMNVYILRIKKDYSIYRYIKICNLKFEKYAYINN